MLRAALFALCCCVLVHAEEGVLRVGVGNSPPFSFIERGKPVGIEVELLAEITRIDPALQFAGLDEPSTIGRVIEEEREGHIDVSFSAKSPARAARYYFLEPAIEVTRVRLLARADDGLRVGTLDELAALGDKGVVLVLPGSTPYSMVASHQGLVLDAPPINIEQLLQKLAFGRGRFAVGLESSMQYTAFKLGLTRQFRWEPAILGELSLHLVASRRLPAERLARLDAAWKKLAASPKLKEVVQRYAGDPIAETP
jgi:hypothetical protein